MPRRPGSVSTLAPVPVPSVVLAREVPQDVIVSRVRAGAWVKVGHGAYVAAGTPPLDAAIARAAGLHARVTAPHAFSHETAALLHGLPAWSVPDRTHVRQQHRAGGMSDRRVARHCPLPDASRIVVRAGLPVTDLETTTWDCLTSLPPLPALVVADAALRAGADRELLAARAHGLRGRGTARGRFLLGLADDGAESPRETMARFALLRAGLPAPETQVRVETPRGTYWADLGWPRWRLLVEYDGLEKYEGRERRHLLDEKIRRDAIAEAGWRTVHLTKRDTLDAVAARVRPYLPDQVLAATPPRFLHPLVLR